MRSTLAGRFVVAGAIVATFGSGSSSQPQPTSIAPGTRVLLDAHNAYPYNGKFGDRVDRVLGTGIPVAIEQDLVWRPGEGSRPGRSIVSHGEPFDGSEPSLRDSFFERIRPLVERALEENDRRAWPLVVLNLDLKTTEPDHLRALWTLLGEYEAWLTTAERIGDPSQPAPLDVKPVLVLTGSSDAQAAAFSDAVPIGARLRLFGAIAIGSAPGRGSNAAAQRKFWESLPATPLPRVTNYRRWWNAPWSVVEEGGQRNAGEWTPADDTRLRALVRHAHEAGLWIRLWTLNGHPIGEEKAYSWSTGYNFGSIEAAQLRWRAAIAAGADFVATDQYEAFAAIRSAGTPSNPAREIVLEGTITAGDRLAWLERTFDVPPGTARIDVDTSYTDRDRGTAIEFGLYDPVRFRGASRTSKSRFFVSRTAATPSYQPGDLPHGAWRVLMGIPSIRDGVQSTYRVVVRLTPEGPAQPTPLAVSDTAARTGPRWYQGDLHAHTMHSDGFGCDGGGEGTAKPCAAHLIVVAAARRGLDFVAITDHNTTSHHAGMVEVQMRHDTLLLLRGQEVTTFYGHANVFGTSEAVDFRIGHQGMTANDAFHHARRLGGLISINHPGRETGERCTGCGWSAPGTDYALVDAIEVVNGRTISGPTAGEPFWHARLNEGHRLTGIGGGDDHAGGTRADAGVGTPTTVIYAEALTESALLAGIRAGRVYIKTRGPDGPDVRLTAADIGARMGDVVPLDGAPHAVAFAVSIERGEGQRVRVIHNGRVVADAVEQPVAGTSASVRFNVHVRPRDWVSVNLQDNAGITAISNPIYFR